MPSPHFFYVSAVCRLVYHQILNFKSKFLCIIAQETEIPKVLRSREHIDAILHLDTSSIEKEQAIDKAAEATLKELKKIYENAIKPLETLYKYRDLSNRHFGDPEIFSKPLVLLMGPYSGGKSTIVNYLTDNEYTDDSLRTGK